MVTVVKWSFRYVLCFYSVGEPLYTQSHQCLLNFFLLICVSCFLFEGSLSFHEPELSELCGIASYTSLKNTYFLMCCVWQREACRAWIFPPLCAIGKPISHRCAGHLLNIEWPWLSARLCATTIGIQWRAKQKSLLLGGLHFNGLFSKTIFSIFTIWKGRKRYIFLICMHLISEFSNFFVHLYYPYF